MMNRRLQVSSLALEDDDDDKYSLLFPYIISVLSCLICIGIAFQYMQSYVCRVFFGREEPIDPIVAEQILANLSEDQRRAVIQTILSKTSKAVTDSDVSHHNQKKGDADTDLEIPAIQMAKIDTVREGHKNEGLRLCDRADEDIPTSDGDVSSEGEIAVTNQHDTEHQQLEGSRSLCEGDSEEIVVNNIQVDIERNSGDCGDSNLNVASLQVEVSHENRSFHIDECADKLEEAIEEEENRQGLGLISCNSFTSGNLPTPPPTRRLSAASDESSVGNACPICLGGYNKGNMLIVSKHCNHIFHVNCILEWLTNHEECPICRVKMVTEEEMVAAAVALVNKKKKGSTRR